MTASHTYSAPLHSQILENIDNKLTACLHKLVVADDVLLSVQFEGRQCVPVVDLHDGGQPPHGKMVTLFELYIICWFFNKFHYHSVNL